MVRPCTVYSVPCTVHRALCTMHRAPCTVHHAPCTMFHVPCTMCHLPCAMRHAPCAMCHVSCAMCHVPCAMYHVPCAMCHVPCVMCHVPCTMYHVPYTMYANPNPNTTMYRKKCTVTQGIVMLPLWNYIAWWRIHKVLLCYHYGITLHHGGYTRYCYVTIMELHCMMEDTQGIVMLPLWNYIAWWRIHKVLLCYHYGITLHHGGYTRYCYVTIMELHCMMEDTQGIVMLPLWNYIASWRIHKVCYHYGITLHHGEYETWSSQWKPYMP